MKCYSHPYFQPAVMFAASCLNMTGSIIAIAIGEANKNPFFFTSFTTSAMYAISNIGRMLEIHEQRKKSFQQVEMERRELKEIVIQR